MANKSLVQRGGQPGDASSSLPFRSKSVWFNSLVLVGTLAFIMSNTWGALHFVLNQQSDSRAALLDASHSPPPARGTALQTQEQQQQHGASPYGLFVPEGPAIALPSVRTTTAEEESIKRSFYGGEGDKAHLGGFTAFDPMGVSPSLWKHMIEKLGVRTLLDVGCGRGISTSWFVMHGLEYVVCAEGSHDAVEQSLLPKIEDVPNGTQYEIVEHDFSRGPWWPSRTVDAVWCVEFTEHVGRNFQPNYLTAWRKAGLIFMTHSLWGGWHHVEVHDGTWWIDRMEAMGFRYADRLTKEMRDKARQDRGNMEYVPEGMSATNVGQHIWGTLLVFINPLVTARYEHAHLFAEHGCNSAKHGREQECGKPDSDPDVVNLTPLPDSFKPLKLTKEMDDQWINLIKDLK